MKITFRNLRVLLAPVAVLAGGLLLVSAASASVTNTLLTGSSGNVTWSLTSYTFNADSAASGGGNSDVSLGTSLTFAGCTSGVLQVLPPFNPAGCLGLGEGITVNNADLTLTAPSAADAKTFLTFAAHPNLVFSINWPPGPSSANTNCATANSNGLSCSVSAGSPIILTYSNGNTYMSLGVHGSASDTGIAGLATGSTYSGGFSEYLTQIFSNGTTSTPQNIQLYFCPDFVSNGNECSAADFSSGRSITTSQSGTFTAFAPPVPEPSSVSLSLIGILTLLVKMGLRKS
jgi:hypothetical protein